MQASVSLLVGVRPLPSGPGPGLQVTFDATFDVTEQFLLVDEEERRKTGIRELLLQEAQARDACACRLRGGVCQNRRAVRPGDLGDTVESLDGASGGRQGVIERGFEGRRKRHAGGAELDRDLAQEL